MFRFQVSTVRGYPPYHGVSSWKAGPTQRVMLATHTMHHTSNITPNRSIRKTSWVPVRFYTPVSQCTQRAI